MSQEHSENSRYVKSFRELVVYHKAMELARAVFNLSLKFPPEEKYSLTDQIRRASRSVGANIGEAWGKREYPAHFISKLSDSLTEAHETQVWLDHALHDGYITKQDHQEIDDIADHVGALLRNTSAKASSFCGKLKRPDNAE